MSKKTSSVGVKHADVEPTTPSPAPDPYRMGFGDWFDRWPEIFARRWPDSLHGLPFFDDGFRMEQYIDDDAMFVVRGELPGLDPENDVDITVTDGRLTIVAEREDRSEETRNGSFHSEFRYGKFERTVRLPEGAHADDVAATYTDGILEVRIPVDADTSAVTKIPVRKR